MRLFLRMALRNLTRNLRRTVTTGTTLCVGVVAMIFLRGLIDGLETDVCGLIVRAEFGHAQVYAHGYEDRREEEPLALVLTAPDGLMGALGRVAAVQAVTKRLSFPVQIGDGRDLIACKGVGVVPGADATVFPEYAVTGRALRNGDEGVLVGAGLAGVFDITVGQTVTILARTVDGAFSALDLPVVGLVTTGAPMVDMQTVFLSLDCATELLDLPAGTATEIVVRAGMARPDYPALEACVQAGRPSCDLKTWYEATACERRLMDLRRRIVGVALTILALIVALGVSNAILMATYERSREIGTLAAMGFTGRQIFGLFILEAVVLGVIAGSVGCVGGAAVTSYVECHGIPIPAVQREVSIPIPESIHTAYSHTGVAQAWFFAVLLTSFAAVYPAWRATLVEPAEALRRT